MPLPFRLSYKETKIANNHAMETGVPNNAQSAMLPASDYNNQAQLRAAEILNNYFPFSSAGPMPSFDFVIPGGPKAGNLMNFSYSNTEIYYNSVQYSSLSGSDKKVVAFWLPYFMRYGMLQYDLAYNI